MAKESTEQRVAGRDDMGKKVEREGKLEWNEV